jgi:hypothetical protein
LHVIFGREKPFSINRLTVTNRYTAGQESTAIIRHGGNDRLA